MKKVSRGQNAKTKTRMISFDVKIEHDRAHKCNHKFNCKKTTEITYFKAKKQQTTYCLTYLEVSKKEVKYN